MKPLASSLGVDRVIEPPGALLQGATRIEGGPPCGSHEMEVNVESLCLDSTSFRQLVESAGEDSRGVAEMIADIVADKGKMHNPVTGSGGVLVGTVTDYGLEFSEPPAINDCIVTLASLTVTPLTLESVGPIDMTSPQIPVKGTAFISNSAPWAHLPKSIDLTTALSVLDVCGAASQTRTLARSGDTVVIFGAGHAGKIAMAAAREAVGPTGSIVTFDGSDDACRAVENLELSDHVICADLTDAVSMSRSLEVTRKGRADLTIVVVNSPGCEATAILATKDSGNILFFSMATSFAAAALASEGMSSGARMLIGSGYSPDRGEYAISLLDRYPALLEALG